MKIKKFWLEYRRDILIFVAAPIFVGVILLFLGAVLEHIDIRIILKYIPKSLITIYTCLSIYFLYTNAKKRILPHIWKEFYKKVIFPSVVLMLIVIYLLLVLWLPATFLLRNPSDTSLTQTAAGQTEEPQITEDPPAEKHSEEPPSDPTEAPTAEPTIEPIAAPTIKPTEELAEEPTAEPTEESTEEEQLTNEIDTTHPNYQIVIGVYDIGVPERTQKTIDFLKSFNFQVYLVDIDEEDTYENCQILYMPYGWFAESTVFDTNLAKIRDFLKEPDTGLFIGSPNLVIAHYPFRLFDFTMDYYKIEDSQGDLELMISEESFLYHTLVKSLDLTTFPHVDVDLILPEHDPADPFDYIPIVRETSELNLALFSSYANRNGRYVVITGDELQFEENENYQFFFERMILWLAHEKLE